MKLLKALKEKIITSQEIFNTINESWFLNKNGNKIELEEYEFPREEYRMGRNESLGITCSKENLNVFNLMIKNFAYATLLNNTQYIKEIEGKNYNEKKAIISMIMESNASMLFFFISFIKKGQRVISFKNKTLLEQFENTKVDNIYFQDIPLPHSNFYISVEKQFDEVYIDGIFVQKQKNILELVILIKQKQVKNMGELMAYLKCPLYSNGKVQDSLNEALEDICFINKNYEEFTQNRVNINNESDKKIIEYSFRVLINTVLFINQVKNKQNLNYEVIETDTTINQNKIKNNKDYGKYISGTNYHYLLKNNSEQNRDIEKYNASRKISHQFLVTGHYRKQPFGSKDKEQEIKIIWIEPFIKGANLEQSKKLNKYII